MIMIEEWTRDEDYAQSLIGTPWAQSLAIKNDIDRRYSDESQMNNELPGPSDGKTATSVTGTPRNRNKMDEFEGGIQQKFAKKDGFTFNGINQKFSLSNGVN